MNPDNDIQFKNSSPDEMPLTAEPVGFAADEMVDCKKCSKRNPPNRLNCLYCAAPLGVSPGVLQRNKLALKVLEHWENGVNIVINGAATSQAISEAATILGIDDELLRPICEARFPLPIARVETSAAGPIKELLAGTGVECRLVTDEELSGTVPPVRLREVRKTEDIIEFVAFNTGDVISVASEEITHIVTGSLYRSLTRVVEKHSRKERKLLDEAQTSEDEAVIDIYTAGNRLGFRVMQHGFDFSVLGTERDILAGKNMVKLATRLASFATDIRFLDSYNEVRPFLGNVWPPEDRKDPQGIRRSGLGRLDLSSVRSSSNLLQFNKYSRLQSLF